MERYWAFPGGYVELDETVEQALIREVKEEIGLEVRTLQLLGVYSEPARDANRSITIAYIVQAIGDPANQRRGGCLPVGVPERATDAIGLRLRPND